MVAGLIQRNLVISGDRLGRLYPDPHRISARALTEPTGGNGSRAVRTDVSWGRCAQLPQAQPP